MDAFVSNENRASTSVETFPGTIFKISLPNSTSNRSSVASTLSSRSLPYPVDQRMLNREKPSNTSIEPMLEVNNFDIRAPCHIRRQYRLAWRTLLSSTQPKPRRGWSWRPGRCIYQWSRSHRSRRRLWCLWL